MSSFDSSKLTLVNSFTTSSELYREQFENKALTDKMNLLALEPLGHGNTRTESENFTYWDTALMNLQAMEALGVKNAFVLGTSQGGWITVRMALLDPVRISGIIPLGTSMDYESERTRKLGCWDGASAGGGIVDKWTSTESTPNFQPDDEYCNYLIDLGFGKNCHAEVREFWCKTIKSNYQGNDGRRRARMAAINLKERDGLHSRLFDVRCPVMWLHGTAGGRSFNSQQCRRRDKIVQKCKVSRTHCSSWRTTFPFRIESKRSRRSSDWIRRQVVSLINES